MSGDACTILLVEDEFLIALDVQMRLEEAGYKVLNPVASVEEAMAVLDREQVSMAVLDMNIRGSTSFPIAERLQTEGTPFMFLSGNDTYRLQEKFADRLVQAKPIDYALLISKIAELCKC